MHLFAAADALPGCRPAARMRCRSLQRRSAPECPTGIPHHRVSLSPRFSVATSRRSTCYTNTGHPHARAVSGHLRRLVDRAARPGCPGEERRSAPRTARAAQPGAHTGTPGEILGAAEQPRHTVPKTARPQHGAQHCIQALTLVRQVCPPTCSRPASADIRTDAPHVTPSPRGLVCRRRRGRVAPAQHSVAVVATLTVNTAQSRAGTPAHDDMAGGTP
jgi:hypothetical protein